MINNITLFYDQVDQNIKTDNTYSTTSSIVPKMYINNDYDMKVTIANNAVPVNLSEGNNYRVGIGRLGAGTPIVNIPDGDIDQSNASSGTLAISINTASSALETDIGQKSSERLWIEIQANSTSNPLTVAILPCQINNVVYW